VGARAGPAAGADPDQPGGAPGRAVLLWNLDLGPGAQLKPIQLVRP
jgi:hypothetical protein